MMNNFPLTSSQTVGPFFAPALLRDDAVRHVLTQPNTVGERIRIVGHVYDGDGLPVPDALIEIWQANAYGRYNHPADTSSNELDPTFLGFGRSGTDEQGLYWFETIKPGSVLFDKTQTQAPHIVVTVFARGLLNHLVTRMYFADEPANATDPILRCVPQNRVKTLLATSERNSSPTLYQFDIVMQGENETVFFNI